MRCGISLIPSPVAADRLCSPCPELFDVDAAAISLILDGANTGTLGARAARTRGCMPSCRSPWVRRHVWIRWPSTARWPIGVPLNSPASRRPRDL